MADFRYGPVEFYLIGLPGDRPDAATVDALTDLIESGMVRLLDFLIITKSEDGVVTVTEIEDETEDYGFGGVEFGAVGLTGDEDVMEFAEEIPPGTSAALVALELAYARALASKVAASGAVVLATERIPAPVVNALIDSVENEGE